MPRLAAVLVALALALAACGGDDDGSQDAAAGDEAAAREAVASVIEAFAAGDAEATCDGMTEDAQARVGAIEGGGDDCVQFLSTIFDLPGADPAALAGAADYAERFRSDDESVTVAIAGGENATVILTDGEDLVQVPVEYVGDAWLVADASTILFGVGNKP